MESVASNGILAAPFVRDRIRCGRGWDRRMEGGVEARHPGRGREQLGDEVECPKRGRLMQGGHGNERLQLRSNFGMDDYRFGEEGAAMHDAMSDHVDTAHLLKSRFDFIPREPAVCCRQ